MKDKIMLCYSELLRAREVLGQKINKIRQAFDKFPPIAASKNYAMLYELYILRAEFLVIQREIIARILSKNQES